MELAVCWEIAQGSERGLPSLIASTLDKTPAFAESRLLMAIPEHRVRLEGRGRESQTDLWALLSVQSGLASLAVEAKAGEPFGVTLEEWLTEATAGKRERLKYLEGILQLQGPLPGGIRYQLLHRTVSAILEARRFRATVAAVVIQAFRAPSRPCENSWSDFEAFSKLMGAEPVRGELAEARPLGHDRLFLGWVDCPVGTDREFAQTV